MKILLVCNQGMSTSVLVKNMYKYADEDAALSKQNLLQNTKTLLQTMT